MIFCISLNYAAIKASILNRFRDMCRLDFFKPLQIGNCSGYFQNAIHCPRGQPQFFDSHFHKLMRLFINRTERPDVSVRHAGIRNDTGIAETFFLPLACRIHPLFDHRRRLAFFLSSQGAIFDRRHFNV